MHTLGMLIEKLEQVKNKHLPLVFDDGKFRPAGIDSWRGNYRDLAIEYSTEIEEADYTVDSFLDELRDAVGKEFTGYKGGDFLMNEETDIWVANYGMCRGFKVDGDKDCQIIVEVQELPKCVAIITDVTDY